MLGYGISAVLLWYTFYKSGLHLSDIHISGYQWLYFTGAITVFVFSLWLYSLRAQLIWIDQTKNIHTYSSLILGNFYNCILPGNLGEAIRAYHFGRKNNISFSLSLTAIITEKWLDAQVFAVLVIVLFTVKPFVGHFISYSLAYTALVIFILSLVYFLMRRFRWIRKRLGLLAFAFKKIGRFLYKLYYQTCQHLDSMRRNHSISRFVLFFAFIFLLNMLQFYFLQKAAAIPAPVAGIYSSMLISLSMMIIAFIPSAPSNIGVLHYGVYSALILAARQYGIEPDGQQLHTYAVFSIYVHLSFLLPEITLGAIYMLSNRKYLF